MSTSIPYEFVLDYLPADVIVKRMFGMHYIYRGKKIMLILRKRDNEPELNGIWVAANKKNHKSLVNEVPELAPYSVKGDGQHGNWLLITDDVDGLEEAGIKVCELIAHGDLRIGRPTEKPPL
jgi:hypothetical protein